MRRTQRPTSHLISFIGPHGRADYAHPFVFIRGFLSIALAIVGTACATVPEPVANPEEVWQQRQTQLEGLSSWSAFGRLAVRTEEEAWNVSMHWTQQGETYRIRLNAPLGQGSVELSGDRDGVMLRTAKNEVVSASDPEALMVRLVGWQIPVAGLRYWLLGRTETGTEVESMALDVAGRLHRVNQSGWHVEYLGYGQVGPFELPTKVFLENPRVSARLFVSRWELGV